MTAEHTTSPEPRLSAVLARQHATKGFVFGVIAKRTYRIAPYQCTPDAEQVPLVETPEVRDDGYLLRDTDVILQRRFVDIVVEGHAYSPKPQSSFECGVRVGDFVRRVRVFGERRLVGQPGAHFRFTPPEPVEKMSLGWDMAYGGVDTWALADIGDPFQEAMAEAGQATDPKFGLFAYPRNPYGKGYLIEPLPEALEACTLPNLEDPDHLLTPANLIRGDFLHWPTGPQVAALGWLPYCVFPRSVQLGFEPPPYDDGSIRPMDFQEARDGVVRAQALHPELPMPQRLDVLGALQGSAAGMRVREVQPGDPVVLSHLHSEHPLLGFELPQEIPRMAFKLPDARPAELVPHIRTLFIQPDLNRIQIVWVGEAQVDLPIGPEKLKLVQHGVIWPDAR